MYKPHDYFLIFLFLWNLFFALCFFEILKSNPTDKDFVLKE